MNSESQNLERSREAIRQLLLEILGLDGKHVRYLQTEWSYFVDIGVMERGSKPGVTDFVQILLESDQTVIAAMSGISSINAEFLHSLGFQSDTSAPNLPPAFIKSFSGGWRDCGPQRLCDAILVAIELAKIACRPRLKTIQFVVSLDPPDAWSGALNILEVDACSETELEQLRAIFSLKARESRPDSPPLLSVTSPLIVEDDSLYEDDDSSYVGELKSISSTYPWESIDGFLEDLLDDPSYSTQIKVRIPKTAADFEVVCMEFLKEIGAEDAELTRSGPDGGVDVTSGHAIAQAKFHPSQKITVEVVRALAGSRQEQDVQHAILFHYGPGYTADAIASARKLCVWLFELDVDERCFRPVGLLLD